MDQVAVESVRSRIGICDGDLSSAQSEIARGGAERRVRT